MATHTPGLSPSPSRTNMDGEDWPLRVIKYWDEDEEDVVHGAKIKEEPIELRKILGYYEFIFKAYEDEREIAPGTHGSLILVVDKEAIKKKSRKGSKGAQANDIDPAHVKGGFEIRNTGSAFVGLTAHGVSRWTFDGTNLVDTPEEEENLGDEFDKFDFDWSRFFISVVDVVDDNGYSFIQFTHWPSMHESEVTYIGKKQKSVVNLEGLTNGERERLGIFVEEEEIERKALQAEASASARGGRGGRRGRDRDRDRDSERDTSDRRVLPPWRRQRGRSRTRKERG